MTRFVSLLLAAAVCLVATIALVGLWQSSTRAATPSESNDGVAPPIGREPTATAAASGQEATSTELFEVIVRRPEGPPRITLAGVDPQGRTGSVACSTCHSVRKPNPENTSPATLDEFHQGMAFSHGKLACYACHNPDDADTLRLADGSPVAYRDVMTLCSQCHGPQATAFAHGAHGGMNGHWDLTRGPQTKNNCIDCHDPHAPSYPKMIVGFKPRDRFNEPAAHDHEGAAPHGDH